MAQTFGSFPSNDLLPHTVADPDLGAQTVTTVDILGNIVALGGNLQTVINNIVADINDLKAKMRSGVLMDT